MNIPRYDEDQAISFFHGVEDGWRKRDRKTFEKFSFSFNGDAHFDAYSHGYDVGRWLSSCYRKK